jgi:Glycine cleavage H-protein
VGTAVTGGRPFGEVESIKSVSDLYSPVSGTIVGRNDALDNNPELINADPYGQGLADRGRDDRPRRARPADGRRGLRPDGRRSLTATARGGLWQAEGTRADYPAGSWPVSAGVSPDVSHQPAPDKTSGD